MSSVSAESTSSLSKEASSLEQAAVVADGSKTIEGYSQRVEESYRELTHRTPLFLRKCQILVPEESGSLNPKRYASTLKELNNSSYQPSSIFASAKKKFSTWLQHSRPVRFVRWLSRGVNKIIQKAAILFEGKTSAPLPQPSEAFLASAAASPQVKGKEATTYLENPRDALLFAAGAMDGGSDVVLTASTAVDPSHNPLNPVGRVFFGAGQAFAMLQSIVELGFASSDRREAHAILQQSEALEVISQTEKEVRQKRSGVPQKGIYLSKDQVEQFQKYAEDIQAFRHQVEAVRGMLAEKSKSSSEAQPEALAKYQEQLVKSEAWLKHLDSTLNSGHISQAFAEELLATSRKKEIIAGAAVVGGGAFLAATGATTPVDDAGNIVGEPWWNMGSEAMITLATVGWVTATLFRLSLAKEDFSSARNQRQISQRAETFLDLDPQEQEMRNILGIKKHQLFSSDSEQTVLTRGLQYHLPWKYQLARSFYWFSSMGLETSTFLEIASEGIEWLSEAADIAGIATGTGGVAIAAKSVVIGLYEGGSFIYRANRTSELRKIAYGAECKTSGAKRRLARYTQQEKAKLSNRLAVKSFMFQLEQDGSLKSYLENGNVSLFIKQKMQESLQETLGMKKKIAKRVLDYIEKEPGVFESKKILFDRCLQKFAEIEGQHQKVILIQNDRKLLFDQIQVEARQEKTSTLDWIAYNLFGFEKDSEEDQKLRENCTKFGKFQEFLTAAIPKQTQLNCRLYSMSRLKQTDQVVLMETFITRLADTSSENHQTIKEQLAVLLGASKEQAPKPPTKPDDFDSSFKKLRYAYKKWRFDKAHTQYQEQQDLLRTFVTNATQATTPRSRHALAAQLAQALHLA